MKTASTSRRSFLLSASALAGLASSGPEVLAAAEAVSPSTEKLPNNLPSMVEADGRLRFDFESEKMILPGGLQPYMVCTASGAILLQAQAPAKPFPTKRMHYPSAMATVISRDHMASWTAIPLKPGDNGLNLEGGAAQMRDGTLLALDTYITPGPKEGTGVGLLYVSRDDWISVDKPREVAFDLPGIDFYASKDDNGRPYEAVRLHRRILELPSGDLLTTIYGCMKGDRTPSTYMPSMMKSRVMLLRSSDRGANWQLVSTVAVDPAVGTEGFGEPVIAQLNSGRLLCFMRTGRNLYEAHSDDGGQTWSDARPRVFAGLDVNRTELWADMFRKVKDRHGKILDEKNPDELRGAVVDPDLVQTRTGLLVAAFGLRVPQKSCWPHYQHPWNGNYLAVSQDHGESWPNVVRLTSGVPTTHYMAIEETRTDGELFVVYDYGFWGHPPRYVYGRTVKISS